jgi:hypothetical protein
VKCCQSGVCPDCGRDGEQCTFFSSSRNGAPNACTGVTRLLVLSLCCERDGARIRSLASMRNRVVKLSGGANSEGALFALTHVDTYKDGVKRVDDLFVPLIIRNPDTLFWLDRTNSPWRVSLVEKAGADRFTMRQLLATLKIIDEEEEEEDESSKGKSEASPRSQESRLDNLERMMRQLLQREDASANVRAAAALEAAQAKQVETPRIIAAGSNPSVLYSLSTGSGSVVNNNNPRPSGDDAALIQALPAAKVAPDEIMAFLRSRNAPPPKPASRSDLWSQCFAGTSPTSQYTALRAEMRSKVAPRKETLEVYETPTSQQKRKHVFVVWPPAPPEDILSHHLAGLGQAWKRAILAANQRVQKITPSADLGLAPAVPTDVDVFLQRLFKTLDRRGVANVVRAWEALHNAVVDQYVTSDPGRGSWTDALLTPVFLDALGQSSSTSVGPSMGKSGTRDASDFCNNWNLRVGRNCADKPSDACKKRHRCLVCDGEHRLVDCPRRE